MLFEVKKWQREKGNIKQEITNSIETVTEKKNKKNIWARYNS